MHLKVTEWHEGFVKRCSKDAFISRETGLARLFFLSPSSLSRFFHILCVACICCVSFQKRKKNAFLLCIKDARCILNAHIVNCTWIQFLNRKPEVQSHLSSLFSLLFSSLLYTLYFLPLSRRAPFSSHTRSVSRFKR